MYLFMAIFGYSYTVSYSGVVVVLPKEFRSLHEAMCMLRNVWVCPKEKLEGSSSYELKVVNKVIKLINKIYFIY